jgi:hypothetical protein
MSHVSNAGAVDGADTVLSAATGRQVGPRIIWNPNNTSFFAVWTDFRNGTLNGDIFGGHITQSTNTRDNGDGLAVASTALDEESPAETLVGTNSYFVVWTQRTIPAATQPPYNVVGQRFTFSGTTITPIGAGPFTINNLSGNKKAPEVASRNSVNAIVTYRRFDSASNLETERVRANVVTFP